MRSIGFVKRTIFNYLCAKFILDIYAEYQLTNFVKHLFFYFYVELKSRDVETYTFSHIKILKRSKSQMILQCAGANALLKLKQRVNVLSVKI